MRRLLTIVRLVGPHPVMLARTFVFLLDRRRRQTALRRGLARNGSEAAPALRLPTIEIGPAESLPDVLRAAAARLRAEADDVVAHRFSYLGSGPVELGAEIDWHSDFKSGHRWPHSFYRDVRATRLDDASDAKVPWELSRGHQLLTLARAAALFEDDRYAAELDRQMRDWIDRNPPHAGINWVSSMEVGLRAVNWIWALGTLPGEPPPELADRVGASLVAHGRHIWANLEGTPHLRSNHYTADVLGLLAIGAALPGHPEAARWLSFARDQLDTEIRKQVYPDGVSFEGSLSYHGLVLEMFLLAREIADRAGVPLPSRYDERLERMLEVSRAVRHGNGRVPLFGDQDSGRVLPAGFARPPTHDNLLWLGAAILKQPQPLPGAPDEEIAWTLGTGAWRELATAPELTVAPPTAFPEGRIYCLDSARTHLVLTCGDVGQRGSGGHGHNDTFSFELSIDGVPLVIDAGTYAYTSDVNARNAFRGTAAHNTLQVDDAEINPIDPVRVFELRQHARIAVHEWREGADEVAFCGSHDGFARLGVAGHRRTVTVNRHSGVSTIRDEVRGTGRHRCTVRLHLAPAARVRRVGDVLAVERDGSVVSVVFGGVASVEVITGGVSDRYGVRSEAPVIVASANDQLPLTVTTSIMPGATPATTRRSRSRPRWTSGHS